jgi:hypothetical protein
MIIALAGRRMDPAEAKEPRFPLRNVESVRTGGSRRRRVILPFERRRFRETSVTDRPGDWGPLYDQVIGSGGDLVILRNEPDDEAY